MKLISMLFGAGWTENDAKNETNSMFLEGSLLISLAGVFALDGPVTAAIKTFPFVGYVFPHINLPYPWVAFWLSVVFAILGIAKITFTLMLPRLPKPSQDLPLPRMHWMGMNLGYEFMAATLLRPDLRLRAQLYRVLAVLILVLKTVEWFKM